MRRAAVVDQAKRMGLILDDKDKAAWVLRQLKPVVPVSLITFEMEFLVEFGKSDVNIDLFWQTIHTLRDEGLVQLMPDDKVMLAPKEEEEVRVA